MLRGASGVVLLACMLGAGCRQETPIERGVREYRRDVQARIAAAALETIRYRSMSDDQMVHANRKAGLGLGLRLEKTEMRTGDLLKVHLAYENLAASSPISATSCMGFNIAGEDTTTGITTAVPLHFACDREDSLRDNNVVLPQGALKTTDVTVGKDDLSFDHPGQYLIIAGWQSFRPRDGLFLRGDDYSSMPSNLILLTVR